MQDTFKFDRDGKLKTLREVFTAPTDQQVTEQMDARLEVLQKEGHSLAGRTQLKSKKISAKERKRRRKQKHAF